MALRWVIATSQRPDAESQPSCTVVAGYDAVTRDTGVPPAGTASSKVKPTPTALAEWLARFSRADGEPNRLSGAVRLRSRWAPRRPDSSERCTVGVGVGVGVGLGDSVVATAVGAAGATGGVLEHAARATREASTVAVRARLGPAARRRRPEPRFTVSGTPGCYP